MVGFAIEQFNDAACGRGCNTLQASHAMPLSVEVDLACRGRCEILFHNGERAAAICISQAIRFKLHRAGYGIRRPDVEVRINGKKVAAHDLEPDIATHSCMRE